MFLTANNEDIGSLKSPPAMVFRCKRTVRTSASRLLLPFVSSELGNKTTISYLSVQQSKLSHPPCCGWPNALLPSVPSGQPQHIKGDSFDCCNERYEIVVYCSPPNILKIPLFFVDEDFHFLGYTVWQPTMTTNLHLNIFLFSFLSNRTGNLLPSTSTYTLPCYK